MSSEHGNSNATVRAAPAPSRASWTGLLRLSLVAVPIKAYPAVSTAETVRFHQLHADCGQRIRHQKHCPVHGQVPTESIVRGHEYAPGQHVLVEASELERLRPPKDKGLLLEQFVEPDQIDPARFAGRTLYLLPDGRPAWRPYRVLAGALALRGKWAVGRITMAGYRHTVVVRPGRRFLSMHLLHQPSKLRALPEPEAELPDGSGNEQEHQLACTLIDAAAGPVDWARYRDDTAEKLAALVEAKAERRQVVAPADEEPVRALALLDALKQSVAEAAGPKPSATSKRRPFFRRRSA